MKKLILLLTIISAFSFNATSGFKRLIVDVNDPIENRDIRGDFFFTSKLWVYLTGIVQTDDAVGTCMGAYGRLFREGTTDGISVCPEHTDHINPTSTYVYEQAYLPNENKVNYSDETTYSYKLEYYIYADIHIDAFDEGNSTYATSELRVSW